MAKIIWDAYGDRIFETGLDRGVLYVGNRPGVPWNGLQSVSEKIDGAAVSPLYLDGVKYGEDVIEGDFSGSIEAFTYPEEFSECQGFAYDNYGLGYGHQSRTRFGLTYRTYVGNDAKSIDYGYKIHIIYNALASPSDRDNNSIGESIEPESFSWDFTTIPELIPNRRPTSHFVVDSRLVKSDTMEAFEDLIYGTTSKNPQLISAQDLVMMFRDWAEFEIDENAVSGINPLVAKSPINDLEGNLNDGLFTEADDSRLETTSINGLYRLG